MFRSGNFYVEFNIVDETKFTVTDNALAYGFRRSPLLDVFGNTYEGSKGIFGIGGTSSFFVRAVKTPFVVLARQNGDCILKEKDKAKVPMILYQDGNYYKYIKVPQKPKQNHFAILPEEQLYSPVLDPDEGWTNIINELALPDELAIFYWNDPYRDANLGWGEPVYVESSTKTIKKKDYDCDRYASDIKDMAGNIIAQEVYDAIYDNGNLIMIQKSFLMNDRETLIETVNIKNITADVPDTAFAITKKTKVYAAHNGDMNDLLEINEQVGEIGGKKK